MKKIISYLLIMAIMVSCHQEEVLEPDSKNTITVDEAKAKFNQVRAQAGKSSQMRTLNQQLGIKWEGAAFRDLSVGEVITFPVDNAKGVYVSAGDGIKRFSTETTAYARAFKLDNEVVLELIQPIPTKNTSKFTGIVEISDWSGQLKKIYKYKDGNYIKTMVPVDADQISENARMIDCTTTTTWFCVDVTVGAILIASHCEAEGSVTRCTQDVVDDGGGGPDPDETIESSGGSGGGGSSNGGDGAGEDNCPHPFDPNLTVPCNDATCGEGYVSDGEGGCAPEGVCVGDPIKDIKISTYNNGIQSNRFGCVRTGRTDCNGKKKHGGIDLMAPVGTPVYALTSGRVVLASENHIDFGNWIIIKKGDKFYTYAHLNAKPLYNTGDDINAFSLLGYVGETGNVPNGESHLHLEVKEQTASGQSYNDSEGVNPEIILGTKFDSQGNKINNENCN